MNIEIFKDIKGYEGLYQVSNFGNVKSLNFKRFGFEKILKFFYNTKRYQCVKLCKEGKLKTMRVHVLVAVAFLDHVPDGTTRIVVDHINNIKTDNRVENLQLISNRENISKDRKGISKYTGVSWCKNYNKWCSKITIDGKSKTLGYFKNEIEASDAYQKALKMYNNGDLSFLEPKKQSSQYKGVSFFNNKKWMAYIYINSKRKHLGYFDTELEAHLAVEKALNELNN